MAIRRIQLLVDTGPGNVSESWFVVLSNESEKISLQSSDARILEIPKGIGSASSLFDWLLTQLRPSLEEVSVVLAATLELGLSVDAENSESSLEPPQEERQEELAAHELALKTKIESVLPPSVTAASSQAAAPKSYKQLLHELSLAIQFHGMGHPSVVQSKAILIAHPNHELGMMDRRIAEAIDIHEAVAKLNRVAGDLSISDEVYRNHEKTFLQRFPFLKKKAEKIISWRTGLKARVSANAAARKAGRPLTTVQPGPNSHKIGDLSSRPAWTLYIDETGDQFESESKGKREGRIVGVLFPSNKLPRVPQKPFHGTEATAAEADAMVQFVLDTECGVFGIGNSGLPQTAGERWVSGVIEVVQWVARLLSMNGATVINVAIEQRGEYSNGISWKLLEATILRDLVEIDPIRYRNLRLQLQVFTKQQELRLGYADAIAFSWGSGSAECKERIRASQLTGACLIEGDARQLRRAWDQFSSGQSMEGGDWASIVAGPDARLPNSIMATLLDRYGESVSNQPELWQCLLKYTLAHLDGKAIDLPRLRQEIAWLDRYKPDGQQLPKTVALAWAVGRLATANHEGRTAIEDDALIATLGKALHEERPDLACLGDLYRAVLATNRFDYAAALSALSEWQDVQISIPGLQMWGRVQSSLGQIAAFQGDWKRALDLFDCANKAFERLSDPEEGLSEGMQTATYAAIAAMDDPSVNIDLVRERLSKVFKLDVATARSLASDGTPANKYSHYLLLRYLVTRRDNLLEEAYLLESGNWSYGEGHPWPLIDAYRSHLISGSDPERAKALVRRAIEGCFDHNAGPVMVLIGTAIAVGGRKLVDASLLDDDRLNELQSAFPAAPNLIDRLLSTPDNCDLPTTLARVLPFNFR